MRARSLRDAVSASFRSPSQCTHKSREVSTSTALLLPGDDAGRARLQSSVAQPCALVKHARGCSADLTARGRQLIDMAISMQQQHGLVCDGIARQRAALAAFHGDIDRVQHPRRKERGVRPINIAAPRSVVAVGARH